MLSWLLGFSRLTEVRRDGFFCRSGLLAVSFARTVRESRWWRGRRYGIGYVGAARRVIDPFCRIPVARLGVVAVCWGYFGRGLLCRGVPGVLVVLPETSGFVVCIGRAVCARG